MHASARLHDSGRGDVRRHSQRRRLAVGRVGAQNAHGALVLRIVVRDGQDWSGVARTGCARYIRAAFLPLIRGRIKPCCRGGDRKCCGRCRRHRHAGRLLRNSDCLRRYEDGNHIARQCRRAAVCRIRITVPDISRSEVISTATFMMHTFKIITLAGNHVDAGGKGKGLPTVRRELVRSLLCGGAGTTTRGVPVPVIAPTRFLGNHAFVGRSVVGAQEQIRIVVTRDEEDIIAGCRGNKQPAEPVRVIIGKIDARLKDSGATAFIGTNRIAGKGRIAGRVCFHRSARAAGEVFILQVAGDKRRGLNGHSGR